MRCVSVTSQPVIEGGLARACTFSIIRAGFRASATADRHLIGRQHVLLCYFWTCQKCIISVAKGQDAKSDRFLNFIPISFAAGLNHFECGWIKSARPPPRFHFPRVASPSIPCGLESKQNVSKFRASCAHFSYASYALLRPLINRQAMCSSSNKSRQREYIPLCGNAPFLRYI